MKPLYEIANDFEKLMHELSECDEITHEQLMLLDKVDEDIKKKSINVAAFIKNLETESDAIEKAIDHMSERSVRILNKIDKLKEYLKSNLERVDIKEVKSPYFDIKIKVNPEYVYINDETLIPSQYYREQIMRRIDKSLLSHDLKNNRVIPGARLDRKTRIEIR